LDAKLDAEVDRMKKELPPGWRGWHHDGLLYAIRGDKRVHGETVDKVVARAILRDGDWMGSPL
jgi:hypothetical protein